MSWTQPLCRQCWDKMNPGREPTRVVNDDTVPCCQCGTETAAGIYGRLDPTTVAYPWPGDR